MTRLLVDPATDFDDPAAVTLTATLLDPGPTLVRTFEAVTAATVVDLPAPGAAEAWRLTVRRPVITITRWNTVSTNPGPIVEERTVHWTGTDPLAWAALTDVDPATLKQPAGSPLLDISLDELRARILGGASAAHDTLKELEDALAAGSASADLITALAGKAPLVSPDFTGTPTISGVPVARTTDLAPSSSLTRAINVITGNGTAVIGARNSVNASAGPATVTLPAPTAVGQHLIIERADASNVAANTITVTGPIRGVPNATVILQASGAAYEGALYIAESLTSWAIAGSVKPRAVLDATYVQQKGLWQQITAKPFFSAHRNAANTYPENSLEGVRACVEAGVDALNVDTWPLTDGGLIVIHDSTLDRTTTSFGSVTDLDTVSTTQLVYDAGGGPGSGGGSYTFGGSYGNLRVPVFSEVAAIAGNRIPLEIEAKPTTGSGAALIAALGKYGLGPATVRVSSFSLPELAAPVAAGYTAIYVLSGSPIGVATSTLTSAGVGWIAWDMSNAAFTSQAVRNAEVARWHAAGIQVQVYTALRKRDLWPWLAAGVDEVAADEPLYLKQTWKPRTTDPFAALNPTPGFITSAGAGQFRTFTGGYGVGRHLRAHTNGNFTLVGSMSPIAGAIETTLQQAVTAGATTLVLGPEAQPKAGKALTIDPAGTAETRTPTADGVLNADGTWTVTVPALTAGHAAGARVYGGTWTLTVPITFDVLGSDTSRWAGVIVGCPDDGLWADSGLATESGYIINLRANGAIGITPKVAGANQAAAGAVTGPTPAVAPLVLSAGLAAGVAVTSLPVNAVPAAIASGARFVLPTGQVATASAAVIAGATSVPVGSVTPSGAVASGASLPNQLVATVQRTATQLIVTWAGGTSTFADTRWFGGYFHLGMNSQAAGMQLSYGGTAKVAVS